MDNIPEKNSLINCQIQVSVTYNLNFVLISDKRMKS